MKTTLLIMAAGIGSRFGTGIKQLEPVDDANHIIMDYSIHDAIKAGFNHVVFIIRKDIEKEFKEVIGDRIASICSSRAIARIATRTCAPGGTSYSHRWPFSCCFCGTTSACSRCPTPRK